MPPSLGFAGFLRLLALHDSKSYWKPNYGAQTTGKWPDTFQLFALRAQREGVSCVRELERGTDSEVAEVLRDLYPRYLGQTHQHIKMRFNYCSGEKLAILAARSMHDPMICILKKRKNRVNRVSLRCQFVPPTPSVRHESHDMSDSTPINRPRPRSTDLSIDPRNLGGFIQRSRFVWRLCSLARSLPHSLHCNHDGQI